MALNIFKYLDYRKFLRESYALRKKQQKHFSLRFFAKQAGLSSPNTLKMAMDGTRNLSMKSAEKVAQGFKLGREQTSFFVNLVGFNQANSHEEKKRYYRELLKSKRYRLLHQIDQATFCYYDQWYYVPIREMVALATFKENPVWIASNLKPNITVKQAGDALKNLEEWQFLVRNSKGELVQKNPVVATTQEVRSVAITDYHKSMLGLADQSLSTTSSIDRDITCITLSLAQKRMAQLKEKVAEFREMIITEFDDPKATSANVIQLNFQLFPLTQIRGKK